MNSLKAAHPQKMASAPGESRGLSKGLAHSFLKPFSDWLSSSTQAQSQRPLDAGTPYTSRKIPRGALALHASSPHFSKKSKFKTGSRPGPALSTSGLQGATISLTSKRRDTKVKCQAMASGTMDFPEEENPQHFPPMEGPTGLTEKHIVL